MNINNNNYPILPLSTLLSMKVTEVELLNPTWWEKINDEIPSIQFNNDKTKADISNLKLRSDFKYKCYQLGARTIHLLAMLAINNLVPPIGFIYHSIRWIFSRGKSSELHLYSANIEMSKTFFLRHESFFQ